MEYRVLGPLEVLDASGQKVSLGGAMQQSVLAMLLLQAGRTVALDRLIDGLWEDPPETAARTAQVYVSRLRRALPDGAIETRTGGYAFVLEADELDLATFEQRATEGRTALAAADYEWSAALLEQALAVWRGPALSGLASGALHREAERLEEERLSVLESRIDADLGTGRDAELVGELSALVSEHPLRERLRAQLMTALYRSGRPSEALAAYREARYVLVNELGMEPGQKLRELEQAILRQDTALHAPGTRRAAESTGPAATEPARKAEETPARELRKTVTVLFCDVVGSTALGESSDPEIVRALLAEYFERMKTIIEHHGGTVEKFIGDAVMSVFGVPLVHEDDALRACRAALEMRESFAGLGVDGRLGIATGEVVAGTQERLATGDAVNVAARLEQVADSGEVLLDAPTLQLVRAAVDVEALPPLALKGKADPVEAYRLAAVRELPERLHETRFVGREREVAALRETWGRLLPERRCELVTIVGEAGVGKSRLVYEVLRNIDNRVVQGRCLPYGEGITYWPVVEVVKQLDTLPSDEQAANAIQSLLGQRDLMSGTDEIAWAFRKLLEEQAPLIVYFDDIQWAEETFLDLVESIALLSTGAPLLLVCMARPELFDRRPRWPATLPLEPLPPEEAGALVGDAVPEELRQRIVRTAGGNPLFLTEILALAGNVGEVVVPPTLRALLAMRLDQLDEAERRVLERGAVEGELFHRGAIQALAPEEAELTPRLAALVRRGLVRPDRPVFPSEDAYRFRHLLIRDAAYEALAKATRADLHRRFAEWLEEHGESLVELDEILGYHLEQASRYLAELGRRDVALELAAGEHLTVAAKRAGQRADIRAAAGLLERGLALTRSHRFDVHLEVALADAYRFSNPQQGLAIAEAAAQRAATQGDGAGLALARLIRADMRLQVAQGSADEVERLAHEALPLLEAADDDEGLVYVWGALGLVANVRGHLEDWAQAAEQAIVHARAAGPDNRMFGLGVALQFGPRPAREALKALDAVLGEQPHPTSLTLRAVMLAMLDRIEEAWAVALPANERACELGIDEPEDLAEIAALAGDDEAAAAYLRAACDLMEANGRTGNLSLYAPRLGHFLCALGRHAEAEPLAQTGRELGDPDDVATQARWRQTQALVHAASGRHADAERLAREAVTWAGRSDSPVLQGDALSDLAEVLEAAGRRDEAIESWQEALDRYERKQIIPLARRVCERLAAIQTTQA
jgi:class 3 adenylate cyclase